MRIDRKAHSKEVHLVPKQELAGTVARGEREEPLPTDVRFWTRRGVCLWACAHRAHLVVLFFSPDAGNCLLTPRKLQYRVWETPTRLYLYSQ